jgi:hypothetical protein
MLCRVLFVSVLACGDVSASEQVVAFEDSGAEWAERYVRIPLVEFSSAHVRDLVLAHLQAFERQKVVKIAIATNSPDLLEIRRGKGMADYSYQLWAEILAERQRRRGPLAVAIKIKGDAVVKIRDGNGASTETVLYGRNPLVSLGPGGWAETLHVGFSKVPQGRKMEVHVFLFVKTEVRLSIPQAENVVRALGQTVGVREKLFVVLREDDWFIENEFFPVSDPFGELATPPTPAQYVCIPTAVCLKQNNRRPECRHQGYLFGKCP